MNDVAERLRASKAEFEERERCEGKQHGRDWAVLAASYEELRKLAKLELRSEDIPTDELAIEVDRAFGMRTHWDWDNSFWRNFGDELPSDGYVLGFIDGASEIWSAVSDQL